MSTIEIKNDIGEGMLVVSLVDPKTAHALYDCLDKGTEGGLVELETPSSDQPKA